MMMIAVMLGGALGALCRYLTGVWMKAAFAKTTVTVFPLATVSAFPLATLTVNVVGAFLLAFIMFSAKMPLSPTLKTAITTGFLGSLTTFSTFELETYLLADEGKWMLAMLYVCGNLVLGMLAVLLGRSLGQQFF